jgi:hypothetical protein
MAPGWPEDEQAIVHKTRFYDARVGLVCPQNTGQEAMKEVAGGCGWIKSGRVRVSLGAVRRESHFLLSSI